jgi:RNA polymerase primary sigma factor
MQRRKTRSPAMQRGHVYATWWVRQAMTQAVVGAIAVEELRPRRDADGLTETERRMLRDLGREPTPEELAAELELSPP